MSLVSISVKETKADSTLVPYHPWIKIVKDLSPTQIKAYDDRAKQTLYLVKRKTQLILKYE